MAHISIKKYSLLGLVLTGTSLVITAMVSKEKEHTQLKVFNGIQQASTGCPGNQITCVKASADHNCTFTDLTGTTNGVGTSIGNNGSSVCIGDDKKNSSMSPTCPNCD